MYDQKEGLNILKLKFIHFTQKSNPQGQNACSHIIHTAPINLVNLDSKSKGLEADTMFMQGKQTGQTFRGQQARSDSFWAVEKSQANKTKISRT